ncbi:MAG: hypothetical protein LC721_09090, partial [Actinobacteria bacterium]|nr:hypothetical protein [Actinomycetota bacterium]
PVSSGLAWCGGVAGLVRFAGPGQPAGARRVSPLPHVVDTPGRGRAAGWARPVCHGCAPTARARGARHAEPRSRRTVPARRGA